MEIVRRKEAKERGAVRYFTGKPCKYGHVFERLTCDGGCVHCKSLKRSRSWYAGGYAKQSDKRAYLRRRLKVLEKRRLQYLSNPEKYKQRARRQYRKHHDYCIRYAKQYREQNRDRMAVWSANYAKRRPEVYRDAARRRRASLAKAAGHFSNQEWITKCREYGNRCASCLSSNTLHADHIVPLSLGGNNFITNIQPLCKSCNSRKATKIIKFAVAL